MESRQDTKACKMSHSRKTAHCRQGTCLAQYLPETPSKMHHLFVDAAIKQLRCRTIFVLSHHSS